MTRSKHSLLWALPLIGSLTGALVLFVGLGRADSAPQEAVVLLLACTLAVLPYVIARSISEISPPE
jgi:hypothetical protein